MSRLPIYSTVTVDAEYTKENTLSGQGDILGSLPDPAVGPLESGVSVPEGDVFAVGIHATNPPIGTGDAEDLGSLIGLRVLSPGTYSDLEIPVFPVTGFPELTTILSGQTFPPNPTGQTEVRAAIWEDFGPDVSPFAVTGPAAVTELDQNDDLDPTDISSPAVLELTVTYDLPTADGAPQIEEIQVLPEIHVSEPIAQFTDTTLPLDPSESGTFEAVIDSEHLETNTPPAELAVRATGDGFVFEVPEVEVDTDGTASVTIGEDNLEDVVVSQE